MSGKNCEHAKKQLSKSKSQRHAWKMNLLETYLLVAYKLFINFIYLARIGRRDFFWFVNKLARAVTNGQKHAPNVWRVLSLTFITHVKTGNVAMWEIQHNNADWDCFKTGTLREILKIQNPLLEEHCAFSEVTHLFQSVGCVRNKLLFRTVQQNLKLFLWTRD